MNVQIAFYLPDTLLPNGCIFHISTNCVGSELGSQRCCPQWKKYHTFLWVFCFLAAAAAAAYRFSRVQLCATLWTAACQVPLSLGFSRQEDWSGLPCWPPADLPDPGIKPRSSALQADSFLLSHQGSPLLLPDCWLNPSV